MSRHLADWRVSDQVEANPPAALPLLLALPPSQKGDQPRGTQEATATKRSRFRRSFRRVFVWFRDILSVYGNMTSGRRDYT